MWMCVITIAAFIASVLFILLSLKEKVITEEDNEKFSLQYI